MPQERLPSLLCASGEFWNSPSNVGRQEMVYQFGSIEFFLLSNKLIHSATTVACSITGTRRFIWRSQWSTHPSYVFCLSMDVIKCWAYQIAEILTTKSSTYPPYTESSNKQMKPVSQISLDIYFLIPTIGKHHNDIQPKCLAMETYGTTLYVSPLLTIAMCLFPSHDSQRPGFSLNTKTLACMSSGQMACSSGRQVSWRIASDYTNEFPPFVVIHIWQCQPGTEKCHKVFPRGNDILAPRA